jgi:hypothetical protein
MATTLYPGGDNPVTPNLGLALWDMSYQLAENMLLIDAAVSGGGGTTIQVNGVTVSPLANFNDTLPGPGRGNTNVKWQMTAGGLISAFIPTFVSSVGMIGDGTIFNTSVLGSPIISAGNLAPQLLQQTANTVLAGPTAGGSAQPTFRALVLADLPGGIGTGTVTSVAMTGDGTIFNSSVTGSPITTAGTLAPSLVAQAANTVLAGPTSGGNVAPTFRALTAQDLPAGTGTVTTFSAGTLSPIFTTGVANPTTTPALIFSLSNAAQNAFLGGPSTGGAGAPAYRALVAADLPLVPWSSLTNAVGNLTLANAGFTSTFNQTSAVIWAWANTTPTVTGATNTVALSTSVAPSNAGGNSWIYTLAASESGAGSNGWVGAAITISGYTGGATGNNGTSLPITASTTTTITVTNATGTTTNTGTPVAVSSAVSGSPIFNLSGTINSGTAGTLNSIADTWAMQSIANSVAPNPVSTLLVTHTGSTGKAFLQAPNFQLPGTNALIDVPANGATIAFSQQNGNSNAGGISWGSGPGNFGLVVTQQGKTIFLQSNFTTQTGTAASIGNVSSFTATSGAIIGLEIGNNGGTGATNTLTFNPASGTASFQACVIDPVIKGTSSGNTTALVVNPTFTLTNLTGTNLILDLQSGGTSQLNVGTTGLIAKYGSIATVSNGVPSEVAVVDLTGQSAAIVATTLYNVPAGGAGMYRISWSATITTASDTSSVLGGTGGFQIGFTSPTDNVSKTTVIGNSVTSSANTTATAIGGTVVVYSKAGGTIAYKMGYTSVQTTTAMVYELHIKCEAL